MFGLLAIGSVSGRVNERRFTPYSVSLWRMPPSGREMRYFEVPCWCRWSAACCFIMDTIHDVDFGKLGSLTHGRRVMSFNSAENRHPVSRIYLSRVTSAEAALVMVFRPVSGTCMAPS